MSVLHSDWPACHPKRVVASTLQRLVLVCAALVPITNARGISSFPEWMHMHHVACALQPAQGRYNGAQNLGHLWQMCKKMECMGNQGKQEKLRTRGMGRSIFPFHHHWTSNIRYLYVWLPISPPLCKLCPAAVCLPCHSITTWGKFP